MKFLWTDDKTGRFSDTTLRTWLLFFLFFFTSLAMVLLELIFPGSITERAITLLDVTVAAAGGGGALYLGKRINERAIPPSPPAPLPEGEGRKGGAP